jgi:hypothetical protein
MKSTGLAALLGALVAAVVFAPVTAQAQLAVGDTIKLYDGFGASPGGEFNADIVGTAATPDFLTFCVEKNETFTYGQSLQVAGISTAAVLGGVDGGSPDPLDARTAYLYTQFSLGTLSTLGASAHYFSDPSERAANATSLQLAIWFIEEEIAALSDAQALAWVAEAQGEIDGGRWSGLGNVRVLNLMKPATSSSMPPVRAQDQLYMAPIPEPETYAMLLAGLGLLGVVARRRSRA